LLFCHAHASLPHCHWLGLRCGCTLTAPVLVLLPLRSALYNAHGGWDGGGSRTHSRCLGFAHCGRHPLFRSTLRRWIAAFYGSWTHGRGAYIGRWFYFHRPACGARRGITTAWRAHTRTRTSWFTCTSPRLPLTSFLRFAAPGFAQRVTLRFTAAPPFCRTRAAARYYLTAAHTRHHAPFHWFTSFAPAFAVTGFAPPLPHHLHRTVGWVIPPLVDTVPHSQQYAPSFTAVCSLLLYLLLPALRSSHRRTASTRHTHLSPHLRFTATCAHSLGRAFTTHLPHGKTLLHAKFVLLVQRMASYATHLHKPSLLPLAPHAGSFYPLHLPALHSCLHASGTAPSCATYAALDCLFCGTPTHRCLRFTFTLQDALPHLGYPFTYSTHLLSCILHALHLLRSPPPPPAGFLHYSHPPTRHYACTTARICATLVYSLRPLQPTYHLCYVPGLRYLCYVLPRGSQHPVYRARRACSRTPVCLDGTLTAAPLDFAAGSRTLGSTTGLFMDFGRCFYTYTSHAPPCCTHRASAFVMGSLGLLRILACGLRLPARWTTGSTTYRGLSRILRPPTGLDTARSSHYHTGTSPMHTAPHLARISTCGTTVLHFTPPALTFAIAHALLAPRRARTLTLPTRGTPPYLTHGSRVALAPRRTPAVLLHAYAAHIYYMPAGYTLHLPPHSVRASPHTAHRTSCITAVRMWFCALRGLCAGFTVLPLAAIFP